MSGICGVWAFDGSEADIDPLLAKLERRGPDGTRRWHDGPVALGHTLLATTPESLIERLPLTEAVSGCTVTADVRLDNREELIAALSLEGETRTIGDGELILRAYLKWGEDCPAQLLGDFAFAIWDSRAQRLFCARDHMGMRQLIYHHAPGELFAFATEADALVVHPRVPKRINEGRIADFLDDLEGIDFTSTFFEDLLRLPPAHRLTITTQGTSLRRYWELRPEPELKLNSNEAYAEAFLEVYTEAVRCRLRSAGAVGSMLSGGLDSGSVVAIAAKLMAAAGQAPLHTFSAVSADPAACIETRMARLSAGMAGLAPHFVNYDDLGDDRAELRRITEQSENLFDAHMSLVRAVYLIANRLKIKVVIDGAGSDVVLNSGNPIVRSLLRGRVLATIRELRGQSAFWGPTWSLRKTLTSAIWAAFAPDRIRKYRRRLKQRREDRAAVAGNGVISADFATRVDVAARQNRFRTHNSEERPSEPGYRLAVIKHPNLVVARERYDRVASVFAVEARDPFLDIRLIRFCLSLPADQLELHGWPKIILRRAMADYLPEIVIWRRGKEHLGWAFTQSVFQIASGWQQVFHKNEPIRQYVAEAGLDGRCAMDKRRCFELAILSNWLKRNEMR